jgi:hypothetical protein
VKQRSGKVRWMPRHHPDLSDLESRCGLRRCGAGIT